MFGNRRAVASVRRREDEAFAVRLEETCLVAGRRGEEATEEGGEKGGEEVAGEGGNAPVRRSAGMTDEVVEETEVRGGRRVWVSRGREEKASRKLEEW